MTATVIWMALFFLVNVFDTVASRRCNGKQEYCHLAFNQFTFPGTHNSGSGFNGSLRRCRTGSEEDDCIWRNQNLNISAQLDLGIRFLTTDVCILPDDCNANVYGDLDTTRLMACQGGVDPVPFGGYRYAGTIIEVLSQISEWMNREDNRNEVIGLQFTHNSPEHDKSTIVERLIPLLEQRWCSRDSENCSSPSPANGNVTLNTFYNLDNLTWPTLSQAIESNSRIFAFIDDGLNVNESRRMWMNPAPVSTFIQQSSHDCSGLLDFAQYCNTSDELVSATGFMLGVCNSNLQQDCNPRLENATRACFELRQLHNQTVNVILVDYPEQAQPSENVTEVARMLNEMNIQTYATITPGPMFTTVADVTSTSTMPNSGVHLILSNYLVIVLTIIVVIVML